MKHYPFIISLFLLLTFASCTTEISDELAKQHEIIRPDANDPTAAITIDDLKDLRDNNTIETSSINLKSGNDCFKLYHHDTFSYADSDAFWAAKLPDDNTKELWVKNESFNISPKCTVIKDGQLVLQVKKVNTVDTDFTEDEVTRAATRKEALVGGVWFGKNFEYGYLEATLKIKAKEEVGVGGVWCGFYTYGTKQDANGKWVGGYEFDILEQPKDASFDIVYHWPHGDSQDRFATVVDHYPSRNNEWIKAAVAWTPEKVVFYIDDKVMQIYDNENSLGYKSIRGTPDLLKNLEEANSHPEASPDVNYQVVADIAQRINLVVAANTTNSYADGGPVMKDTTYKHGWSWDFITYKDFKLYDYVGTITE